MAITGEILVLPFYGQGHLFPCIELCKHLSSRNFQTTLLISSAVSSSIPSSLRHPLIHISEIPCSPAILPPPKDSGPPFSQQNEQMRTGIEVLLSARLDGSTRPVCAVIDIMMTWSKGLLAEFGIPTVSFFTSGACCPAMEYATWKARVDELKPGETRHLPGLPDDMAFNYSDLHGAPPGSKSRGIPGPGAVPIWTEWVEGTIAILINTCHDLEGPFVDYMGLHMGKPVWGVGPLLPEEYYNAAGSVLRDREIRPNKKSSHSEEEVIQWLDAKPKGSVLYISFGTEVGPSEEEYAELEKALEETNHAFIWVIRKGELEDKVGDRGLVIRGWAPQLLILSHPSTGGFLTHCGWNSTVEAIGRGVPTLTWPIRGDQFYNAKMLVSHLKIGHSVREKDMYKMVEKEEIVKGIDKLMGDQGAKLRAMTIRGTFEGGFPASSEAAFDAFTNFVGVKTE